MEQFNLTNVPEAADRYVLEECIGTGIHGKVFRAKDTKEGERSVAIKTVTLNNENMEYIKEEYTVLQNYSNHPNLPEFYGIFRSKIVDVEEVWFVLELCEGPVIDLVNGLKIKNRRMAEEHIAFILKQVVKALIHLHDKGVIHRDVKGSNIVITKDGDVKLVDFSLSRCLNSNLSKTMTFIGSPSWIAPEVIHSSNEIKPEGYDNRADVWSLGITALELANGKAPFEDMNPTRAMFQIIRNPPPALNYLNNWSEEFIDFVNECLIKTAEHRPYMEEVIEHPFLTQIPENDYHFTQELKVLNQQFSMFAKNDHSTEMVMLSSLLKYAKDAPSKKMLVEDLASLPNLQEDVLLKELKERMDAGQFYTFVGDILLVLNNSEQPEVFGETEHQRYQSKSRSDNAPHIYAVADAAYQAVLHHKTPQNIVLSGESGSGKTKNYLHIVDHLLYLGQNNNINQERIKDAIKLIHAFTHASTPTNDYSTRCIIRTEVTFGETGKNTGAVFDVYQMDKWRVSSTDMSQANYHMLYYFYDGLHEMGQLDKYQLDDTQRYRYLRVAENTKSSRPRDNPKQNAKKFQKIQEMLKEFHFSDEETETVFNTLAAVINLGEIRFVETVYTDPEIEDRQLVAKVAQLLNVNEKKLAWSLVNYCAVVDEEIISQKHTCDEARDARDTLANILYCRIVQYVVWVINDRLAMGRTLFGEKHSIRVFDMYGFECFKQNHFSQFLINCFNEELQYHYVQRVFAWEAAELEKEKVPFESVRYYSNRDALEEMLSRTGVLSLIDEATKFDKGASYVINRLQGSSKVYVNKINGTEFCVNHYTGKVTYDCKEMPERNRDYLPVEIMDTMQNSNNAIIKSLFTNEIDRSGNVNFTSHSKTVMFVQNKRPRTSAASFKALSMKILQEISVGGGTGGTYFVRCIRSDLQNAPKGFHKGVVRQQIRALSILETAKARQCGFPCRISFPEFMRRYQFLAFDFNENVEASKENCRLLLVRLKMEGWAIGSSKVLLKYYNEEYLSRYYETHVKKIIKIQSMIRSYLVKRSVAKKAVGDLKGMQTKSTEDSPFTEDVAATIVQKAYRDYARRKDPTKKDLDQEGVFSEDVKRFISGFCSKWKAKTIFQVLLQYRAAKYMDLYNLSQQVHLYNQNVVNMLKQLGDVKLNQVETRASVDLWLGIKKHPVLKIPFRFDCVPYFDTAQMCDPQIFLDSERADENWDAPLHWKDTEFVQNALSQIGAQTPNTARRYQTEVLDMPYCRSPSQQTYCSSPTRSHCTEKSDEFNSLSRPITPVPVAPANKDFDYIRIQKQPLKKTASNNPPNPITELELKGIKNSVNTEDDPPFNFQAMLRKTNYRHDIKKNEHVILESPVIKVSVPNEKTIKDPKKLKNNENVIIKKNMYNETVPELIINEVNDEKPIPKIKLIEKEDIVETVTTNEVYVGVFLEGFEIAI